MTRFAHIASADVARDVGAGAQKMKGPGALLGHPAAFTLSTPTLELLRRRELLRFRGMA
jgi:hypothetical protein